MTSRYADHVLTGDHASRPVATAVAEGTQYSCTDHTVIYQSDGAAWSDYFDGGGAVITDHGALGGLSDDDHPQYATNTEFDDHSARHESGGADAIKIDDLAAGDDNTDLDASTTKHGLLKKLSNVATEFLNGAGNWAVPAESLAVTIIDAKGDLIVGTAADTASRLAVGTNTHVLTADSGEATGVKWAAPSGGSALTVKDEGTPLATDATSLDFVGSGVVASGAGAAKTITITGGSASAVVSAAALLYAFKSFR